MSTQSRTESKGPSVKKRPAPSVDPDPKCSKRRRETTTQPGNSGGKRKRCTSLENSTDKKKKRQSPSTSSQSVVVKRGMESDDASKCKNKYFLKLKFLSVVYF